MEKRICSIVGCIDKITDDLDDKIKEELICKKHLLRVEIQKAIADGYKVFALSADNLYNSTSCLTLFDEIGESKEYKVIMVNPIYGQFEPNNLDVWEQLEISSMAGVSIEKGYDKKAVDAREKWLCDNADRVIEIK